MGIDQESEFVRRFEMTAAHVHDGEMLQQVLSGDEQWAFADKAYENLSHYSKHLLFAHLLKPLLGLLIQVCPAKRL